MNPLAFRHYKPDEVVAGRVRGAAQTRAADLNTSGLPLVNFV